MPAVVQETDVMLRVRGVVQGVGFRPFVHREASRLQLRGWVRNDAQGVLIRAVGDPQSVERLVRSLRASAPPAARVQSVEPVPPPAGTQPVGRNFLITPSDSSGMEIDAAVPPDLAICADCRRELLDPADRRHRYPFINCTQCGPRYSIIECLPYDRPQTTMRLFHMCPACTREYESPSDRRFHAQPNACPECGPQLVLTGLNGAAIAHRDNAIVVAAKLLAAGLILAVKGVGGYHLMVDATNEVAVARLRQRKHREQKPFAVMFRDVDAVREAAMVSDEAAELLGSPAAPIVLVPRDPDADLAREIAPGNPWIGALLPYSPLHLLLLQAVTFPLVATSANLAEEPLCTDEAGAHTRLNWIADAFLEHDRPIAHPVDDSVVRLAASGPVLLRRARGYAPAQLRLPATMAGHWLCVGAQMKSTVGVAARDRLLLSPHIGDLGGAATLGAFQRTVDVLEKLQQRKFTAVACDKHPDYASTQFARGLGLPCVEVQHHLAHVLACLLEHGRAPAGVLGVAWDGTGYGEDGTIWGGEFLLLEKGLARRFARLRPFRLGGGDAAVRDPRRSALGLVHEMGDPRFARLAHEFGLTASDAGIFGTMLERGLNSPVTTSMGRLFDAVGALLGIAPTNHFEGQAPLAVESAARAGYSSRIAVALPVRDAAEGAVCEIDWQPFLEKLLAKRHEDQDVPGLASAFHRGLAHAVVEVARRAGVGTVALSGGCFQNILLLDLTVSALRSAGFTVLTHRELPPNDGNIAAGQAYAALRGLTTVSLPRVLRAPLAPSTS